MSWKIKKVQSTTDLPKESFYDAIGVLRLVEVVTDYAVAVCEMGRLRHKIHDSYKVQEATRDALAVAEMAVADR